MWQEVCGPSIKTLGCLILLLAGISPTASAQVVEAPKGQIEFIGLE
jgi:hypothetical protein